MRLIPAHKPVRTNTHHRRAVFAQKLFQIPATQELGHDEPVVFVESDADEFHNVRMIELTHDDRFGQEVTYARHLGPLYPLPLLSLHLGIRRVVVVEFYLYVIHILFRL